MNHAALETGPRIRGLKWILVVSAWAAAAALCFVSGHVQARSTARSGGIVLEESCVPLAARDAVSHAAPDLEAVARSR